MIYNVSTLKNGIKLATCELPNVDSVSIGIWTDIGARYENTQNNGISHFLEHMLFKGTKTRTPKEIAEVIENVGGYMNAYTTNETTAYYVKVLKQNIKEAVDVLSDMLLNPVFSDIDKEKQVVQQEINQVYDTPSDIVFDYFQENCFPNQNLGMPVLGKSEIVNNISNDDLYNYLRNYFSFGKLVISAAGALNHKELEVLIQEKFISHIAERSDCVTPSHATYVGSASTENRKSIEQTQMIIGFEGAKRESKEYYLLSVFSSILGGGMSSKLFQEVRETRGLVYSIYSFLSSFKDTGIFGIYAGTDHQKYKDVINVSLDEINNLQISDIELFRAKNQLKSAILMSNESTFAIAEKMANQIFATGNIKDQNDTINFIDSITKEDLFQIKDKLISSNMTSTIITN